MKLKLTLNRKALFILLIAAVVGFSSCRTARELPAERLRPMATEKLLNQVQQNAFDYDDLNIRRINVQYSTNSTKTSFRASLKAIKNEKILASISKINIPVGRVMLTPDGVTYVNYIEQNYFLDDYSFLSNFLNFTLNFEIIQSIISNNPFSYMSEFQGYAPHAFDSYVEEGRYVLRSARQSGMINSRQKKNTTRSANPQSFNNESGIVYTRYFNRKSFALERMLVDDLANNWKLEIEFNDFVKVEKKEYPGSIFMKMSSPDEVIEMRIKLNGFSTEKIDSINLNIPESYEQIRVN